MKVVDSIVLYPTELQEACSIERQLVDALPKVAAASSSAELQTAALCRILDQEKQADEKLTSLAKEKINPVAVEAVPSGVMGRRPGACGRRAPGGVPGSVCAGSGDPTETEEDVKANEIMTLDVHMLRPDDTIRDAARKMSEKEVGAVPVAESNRLVGMITDWDVVVRAVAEGRSPDTHLRDVMSLDVRYCFDDEELDDVSQKHGRHSEAPTSGGDQAEAAGGYHLAWRSRDAGG